MNELYIGIDVGSNSVGLAALAVNENGTPQAILNSVVYTHDAGVDPTQRKSATTRLAVSGAARRSRRLYRRRYQRLQKLDSKLTELGWPIINLESFKDPYFPWKVRAQLASEKFDGPELEKALSIALRHIARHRGWRNPYARVETLFKPATESPQFKALKDRVTELTGVLHDEDATPAEVVVELDLDNTIRLRSAPGEKYEAGAKLDGESVAGKPKDGILGGKLMQSDNANEIRKIGEVQGLSDDLVKDLIRWVFDSKSPKGAAGKRAKEDELPGQGKYRRALKAHPEFQRFRIIQTIANVSVIDGNNAESRPLTASEKDAAIDYLMNVPAEKDASWQDIADILKIDRNTLRGTASSSPEGERPSGKPPVNVTNQRVLASKSKPLTTWWESATSVDQAGLVLLLSNAEELGEDDIEVQGAMEFMASLSDDEATKVHELSLPAGRAAYSVESLTRLSDRMLTDSVNLYDARRLEFNVPPDWTPPADPIGEPVGNPSVDRVTKIVARWLSGVVNKWGLPASINIEHVRDGFTSQAQSMEFERDLTKRHNRNRKIVAEAHENLGINSEMRSSDITRYLAVRRQNCVCVYCGDLVTYTDCEMDHIVPRKGAGSSNRRTNLVAVCIRCNRAKSNIPFATWASSHPFPGVSVEEAVERVKGWNKDEGLSPQANRNFRRDVISRLRRTEADEAIDERSMESVAWMANELRHRIEHYCRKQGADTKVNVFQGKITAEARKASGFEGKVNLLGGRGKTRLDRRHHAMDAVTIALMRPAVAQVLAERTSLRDEARILQKETGWKTYKGDFAHRHLYDQWISNMERMTELFNIALAEDTIPVMRNSRLRLGNGRAHEDSISPLVKKKIGDEWTLSEIDRASTPAMWCALTNADDFDPERGLPENRTRTVRLHDKRLNEENEFGIFGTGSAALAVRNGWALLGDSVHHARLYRIEGKKTSYAFIRVYEADLQKSREVDLFSAPLAPQSISVRTCDPKLRKALNSGTATYLGWVVTGDELLIDIKPGKFASGHIGELFKDFPGTRTWQLDGFPTSDKFRLRPAMLAGEGLAKLGDASVSAGSKEIIEKSGWRVSLNALVTNTSIQVVRRNALGYPRLASNSNLPTSFDIGD